MTKQENEFIHEVIELMAKCPQASPNPYDMTGWIHAARDYEKIHKLVYSCLSNFAFYSTFKNKLGSDEVDDDWIIMSKGKYQEVFEELKVFVNKRVNEGWV